MFKKVFGSFKLHDVLLYNSYCFIDQEMLCSYAMILVMVIFILMIPCSYLTGHDCHSFRIKNGQKLTNNMFVVIMNWFSHMEKKFLLWGYSYMNRRTAIYFGYIGIKRESLHDPSWYQNHLCKPTVFIDCILILNILAAW